MTLRYIGMALGALRRSGLRTVLSILAVGIGVAAVIATCGLGSGGTRLVDQQISNLGEDFLWIRAASRNIGGVRTGAGIVQTLTEDDAVALAEEVRDITMCSPRASGRQQIIIGRQNWNTVYRGVWPSFFAIRRRTLARGVAFDAHDVASSARVVVLGPAVATRLFADSDPVGATVRVGRTLFRVIGVLEAKGGGRGGLDRDDAIFLPISTVRRSFNRFERVDDIMCAVSSPDVMARAEGQAASLLRARHEIPADADSDFQIQRPVELLQLRQQTAESLRMLLTAIGSVSLVVGGIGIMNIMLVAVTERRSEIGVRLAVGARVSDVRIQFLLEAAVIGLGGGLVGAVLGVLAGWVLSEGLQMPVVVSTPLVATVIGSAVATGLICGYIPAHRASALDPIEAMGAET